MTDTDLGPHDLEFTCAPSDDELLPEGRTINRTKESDDLGKLVVVALIGCHRGVEALWKDSPTRYQSRGNRSAPRGFLGAIKLTGDGILTNRRESPKENKKQEPAERYMHLP